jgi:hypothetical protein
MRQHTHLPAMVRFVRNHVAQHFHASRPRPAPAVSQKLLDAATTATERFREHLFAANGALRQSRASLLWRAVRAVELSWNLQVRRRKPDPLRADLVHVREDRRNRAALAGRFRFPRGRVKMFDEHLVHALIGGKDSHCGSPQLRLTLSAHSRPRLCVNLPTLNLVLTPAHGSLPLELSYVLPCSYLRMLRDMLNRSMQQRVAS